MPANGVCVVLTATARSRIRCWGKQARDLEAIDLADLAPRHPELNLISSFANRDLADERGFFNSSHILTGPFARKTARLYNFHMMTFGIQFKRTTTLAAVLISILIVAGAHGQDTTGIDAALTSWDVFVKHDSEESGSAQLVFINLLTGESTIVGINGERFTLVDGGVIYFDRDERQVKFSTPDGRVADHGFMTMPLDAERIDWIVSEDGASIAWTVTRRDQDNRLLTVTMVSDDAGGGVREVLRDGPWIDSRVMPIAFSVNADELYLDAQPDGIAGLTPLAIHANLFGLSLVSGDARLLPVAPGCFCSTAFIGESLLQLIHAPDIDGIQVKLEDVRGGGAAGTVPAIHHEGFTEGFTSAGGLLPSPDGTLAIYVLTQERSIAEVDAIPQSLLVLADLEAMEQSIVGEPIDGLANPISWSEDNSAVLFTDTLQRRTWKLELSSGTVREVAEALYLGRLDA